MPAAGSRGKGRGHLSLIPTIATDKGGGTSYATLHPQGQLTCTLVYRIFSTALPRRGTGSILSSTAAGKGLGQDPHLPRETRGKERRASFPNPYHHMADKTVATHSPILMAPGPANPCPSTASHENRVSSIVQPR